MDFIIAVGVSFLLVIGLMYAVSSDGRNPTPRQIGNRIAWNRWKRKQMKRLHVDEVLAPFIGGLILIFFVLVFTFKIHGVI